MIIENGDLLMVSFDGQANKFFTNVTYSFKKMHNQNVTKYYRFVSDYLESITILTMSRETYTI
jgi:hypothetical protein